MCQLTFVFRFSEVCSQMPCENNGKCKPNLDVEDYYTCLCDLPFFGKSCEKGLINMQIYKNLIKIILTFKNVMYWKCFSNFKKWNLVKLKLSFNNFKLNLKKYSMFYRIFFLCVSSLLAQCENS